MVQLGTNWMDRNLSDEQMSDYLSRFVDEARRGVEGQQEHPLLCRHPLVEAPFVEYELSGAAVHEQRRDVGRRPCGEDRMLSDRGLPAEHDRIDAVEHGGEHRADRGANQVAGHLLRAAMVKVRD